MIDEANKLTKIALKFLSFRPRLTLEIKNRLLKETKNQTLIDEIIARLTQDKFLNDKIFISDFINYQIKKYQGPFVIKMKLKRLGADPFLVDRMIKDIFPDETQIDLIRNLISKKSRQLKIDFKAKAKLFRFLLGRGFRRDLITRLLID